MSTSRNEAPKNKSPKFRKISLNKATLFAEAIGDTTKLGGASLGVTGQISREVALYLIAIPVIISATIGAIVSVYQGVQLGLDRKHYFAERSLWLMLYVFCNLLGVVGAGLAIKIAQDSDEEIDNTVASISAALIMFGMAGKNILHTGNVRQSLPKAPKLDRAAPEAASDVESEGDDIEEGGGLKMHNLKKSK